MNPNPILFTIPNFITAGSGRVMCNILERLDPALFSPTVCVFKKGGWLETELAERGIEVLQAPFTVPVKPYATFLFRAWRATKPFRAKGFRIWHSFHYIDDYSEPIIARLSGVTHWVYTKKNMSWGSRGWLFRSYLASGIVADNSEMPKRFFDHPGLRRKVRVIHHGLPLDEFHPGVSPELDLRKRYNLSRETITAACVAQLMPVKDYPNIIRAAVDIPGVHFFFAGSTADGAYRSYLEHLTTECGVADRVHFLGSVTKISALLSEVDFFLISSLGKGEGGPVALMEAMACGKSCLATDIPGPRDLIVPEESGLLVPPSDPLALGAAASLLAGDPELRERLGRNARKRVEEHFSIGQEVQAHEALYSELMRLKVS